MLNSIKNHCSPILGAVTDLKALSLLGLDIKPLWMKAWRAIRGHTRNWALPYIFCYHLQYVAMDVMEITILCTTLTTFSLYETNINLFQ